ncbi:hypothetical protein EUGRSUZ_A02038 [Eucalyptus grandis]|uniref:Uncharacterized protein n=2 Tax=Eucalyptus grandis TaxID=71139 RepID=A0ACC3M557_EUCGR|nr:hypothetical protein EUGRSUZ_A02038 [Eucalyptus grandis]
MKLRLSNFLSLYFVVVLNLKVCLLNKFNILWNFKKRHLLGTGIFKNIKLSIMKVLKNLNNIKSIRQLAY